MPTISEKIINSVDTGHKKVYCAGTIFDKTGFYHQPAFLFSRMPHDGAFLKPDFDAIPRLDGKFVAVADQSSTRNFFHWFAETIPALIAIRNAGVSDMLLITADKGLTSWQRESLSMLQEDSYMVLDYRHDPVCVDQLTWRRRREVTDLASADLCRAVDALRPAHAKPTLKVYVRRERPASRSIANQEQIEAIIGHAGFVTIVPERMSLAEQIAVFSSASTIVAAHGAALVSMLFAPEGCRIVEIMPAEEVRQYFQIMAGLIGHSYLVMLAEGRMADQLVVDPTRLSLAISA